jgi:hypothetical protein
LVALKRNDLHLGPESLAASVAHSDSIDGDQSVERQDARRPNSTPDRRHQFHGFAPDQSALTCRRRRAAGPK